MKQIVLQEGGLTLKLKSGSYDFKAEFTVPRVGVKQLKLDKMSVIHMA